ncbi:MAG TPA: NUDIX hydrolase [Jatrophihabitans sp.]|uniref:NUDIX hydrolase n=1 Tax=Jatrophihabitans sp. TaxID=1932789 RepID=UPI002E0ADB57|nr:NUDIX hydrolase [Jatrophihabitans sp.]
MLPVGWLIAAVVVAVLLTMWITFTLTRLDRLHARVDAAQAAMDAQLVRRAAALLHVAESANSGVPAGRRDEYDGIAQRALAAGDAGHERQGVENAVGRAVTELAELPEPLRPDAADELREAAARVLIARRFYNDAVRDTRALRARRLPRLFRMAGRRELPEFFDIDDTLPVPTRVDPPTRH